MHYRRRHTKPALLALTLVAALALAAPAFAQQQVTLTVSTWWLGIESLDEHMRALGAAFEAKNPGVKVEFVNYGWGEYLDKLTVAFAGGTAPDVYFVDQYWVGDIIANGLAENLDPYIQRDGLDMTAFRPGGLRVFQSWWAGNNVYGLPVFATSYDITANLTMIENAGLVVPPRDWTTDDFVQYCRSLTVDRDGDGTPDQWCMANPFHLFKTMIYNYGGEVLRDGKLVMDSAEAIAGATFPILVQQSTQGMAPQGQQAFLQLQAAMTTEHPPFNPETEYIILEMPKAVQQTKNILTHGYMVSSATPHKAEAWEFVKFVAAEEGSLMWAEFGSTPARYDSELWITWLEAQTDANVNRRDVAPLAGQPEASEPTMPGWLRIHDEWAYVFGQSLLGNSDYTTELRGRIGAWQSIVDNFLARVR